MYVPILAYHNIGYRFDWGINTVSPHLFERHIQFLSQHGFQTISLNDLLADGFQCRKPIIITFDDAYQSIYQFALPVLEKYGYTAEIFVISGYVGKGNDWDTNLGGRSHRHLDWDELKSLIASGWTIGSHTVTHPDLTRLPDDQLYFELSASKQHLEQQLQTKIEFISYPFNCFNARVIKMAEQADYRGGCCLAKKNFAVADNVHYTIPRSGVYSIDHLYWFRIKLKKTYLLKLDVLRQRIISTCAVASVYYNRTKKWKKSIAI